MPAPDSEKTPVKSSSRKKLGDIHPGAKRFKDLRFEVVDDEPLAITTDINLAAYFKGVLGFELHELRDTGRFTEMVFKVPDPKNPTEAAEAALDFYNNKGIAGKYLEYTNAWYNLKTMIPAVH